MEHSSASEVLCSDFHRVDLVAKDRVWKITGTKLLTEDFAQDTGAQDGGK